MKHVVMACLLLLAACRAGTADYTPTPFRFNNAPPIRFNVAEIRIVNAYTPALTAPNVDHAFATSPAQAIAQWSKDRLKAAGSAGILEVTIDNANVKESRLPVKSGIEGLFTDEPASRFDSTIAVSMRLYTDSSGLSAANAEINVTRFDELREDASVADRQRLHDTIVSKIMASVEAQAQRQIGQYFAGYLLP